MPGALLPILPFILLAFQGDDPQHTGGASRKVSIGTSASACLWRRGDRSWEVAVRCIGKGYRWVWSFAGEEPSFFLLVPSRRPPHMPFILFLLQFGRLPDVTDLGRLDTSGLKVSFLGAGTSPSVYAPVLLTVAPYTLQCWYPGLDAQNLFWISNTSDKLGGTNEIGYTGR